MNRHQVDYLVVGGFAIIQQGLVRTTEDVDLLLDPAPGNQERVKQALLYLPDKAVRELGDEDLRRYVVVRVADEILIDLMFAACGITYAEAVLQGGVESHEVQGVTIPFASARLLWRMKQTVRDKDVADRAWLRAKLGLEERSGPSTVTIPRWLWLGVLLFAGVLTLAWVVAWLRGFQPFPPNP